MPDNTRIVLAERPARGPITEKTFRKEVVPVRDLRDGEVLVKVEYVSIDATMRTWLNDVKNYLPPVKIGAVMRAIAVGRVIKSHNKGFREGDLVQGALGWQEYWVGNGKYLEVKQVPRGGKPYDHLGLYGTAGMTAYFGMFDIGRLKDGDRVLISGAAGSVGLIAAQMALSHPKCHVIAIAGTPAKCEDLRKMGCHQVLNYKDEGFKKEFRKIGLIDVFFDNVGGEILDLALTRLNDRARIVVCGAISQYNTKQVHPIHNTPVLISTKSKMEGFIVFDYESRYPEAVTYLADLQQKGKMEYQYHVVEGKGVEECEGALRGLYGGENVGKVVVKVAKDGGRESKL